MFQSPAQSEALASPPPPQPVFAEVKVSDLSEKRSYDGLVLNENETSYSLTPAADAVRSVVTGNPPVVSQTIRSGDLLTEVNTRPVFVVGSAFDFFRDIGFGDEGADVRVLQESLVAHQYLDRADGKFGLGTAQAVVRWYKNAGYEAPTRLREDLNAVSDSSDSTDVGNTPQDSGGEADAATSPREPAPITDAYVPFEEIFAVSVLPAIIITAPVLGAHVGVVGATDLTLGSNQLIVRTELPSRDAAGIQPGDSVVVVSESGEAGGSVLRMEAQAPGEDGTPRPSVMTVKLGPEASTIEAQRGATLTVQVESAAISGESLVVPTAAVVGRGTGHGVVVKRLADGTLVEVSVAVEGSLRGMTAVVPDGSALVEGDDVRVG